MRRQRPVGWALLAKVLLTLLLAVPPAAEAQTPDAAVAQRRLELRAARQTYESALAAFREVEALFTGALNEVRRVRPGSDSGALERAYALAQERSAPYREREQRLGAATVAMTAARQNLADALARRLEELVAQMDAAADARARAALDSVWRALRAELEQLERESGDPVRFDPVLMPSIALDPRDGPEELRFKAELLERQAQVADEIVENTRREIASLEGRLRMQRQRGNLLGDLERFDDTRVPVVAGAPPGTRIAGDSATAGLRTPSLEQRIEAATTYLEDLLRYRDRLLTRAEEFRGRLEVAT